MIEGRVVHVHDVSTDPEFAIPGGVTIGKIRTALGVPLLREGEPIGVITLSRQQVEPFTDRQIDLIRTFADQAVIAIENARLLNELRQRTDDLRELLEYQTATSDVLKIISRSTFDLDPVLQTLVETAVRLCEADFGHLDLPHEGVFRPAATFAFSAEFDAILQRTSFMPDRGTTVGRVLLERRTVHVPDVTSDPDYSFGAAVEVGNVHAVLECPCCAPTKPSAFLHWVESRRGIADKQIELVSTFADQAVIALENARLITETREALEQQTATAEVLQVINSSPGNLTPVFDAMLTKAMELCGASFGVLRLYDGKVFDAVAVHGDPRIAERIRQLGPIRPASGSLFEPLVQGRR